MRCNSAKEIVFRCVVTLLPFAAIFLLTSVYFKDVYLLEWHARHWYCGLWLVASIIAIFNFKLSLVISYSNVIAIGWGQIFGDAIRKYNISRITSDMNAEQRAHLHIHYGFAIWICSLLLFVTVFLVVTYVQKKKTTKRRKENI